MDVKTIDINAKSWFDRINGNSYFSGWVVLNYAMPDERRFKMPFQYGYGDQYVQEAVSILNTGGYLPGYEGYRFHSYCSDNNIILRTNIHTGCLKRDVVNYVSRERG